MENAMILSYLQLNMLAGAQGFGGLAGLPEHEVDESPGSLLTAVNSLAERGLVRAEKDVFRLTSAGEKIGNRLGGAKCYLAVHTVKKQLPDFSCYPGADIMVCTPSATGKNAVSLRFMTADELILLLRDEGYLPDGDEILEPEPEALLLFEQERLSEVDPNAPLTEEGYILFSAELLSSGGTVLGFVRVVSYYFYRYVFIMQNGCTKRLRLTADAVEAALKGLISQHDFG